MVTEKIKTQENISSRSRFTYAFKQSAWNDRAKGHTECNRVSYLASWVLVTSAEVFFISRRKTELLQLCGCSSFDVSSASQLVLPLWDKWEGVLLVGDSSTQWELRAVTTSVCLRYGLFVVLPTTNSLIITHKKYGPGKNVSCCVFFVHCTSWHRLPFVLSIRIS